MPPETKRQPIRFLNRQGLLDPLTVGHRLLGRTRTEDEGPCGREDRGPGPHRAEEMPATEYRIFRSHATISLLVRDYRHAPRRPVGS